MPELPINTIVVIVLCFIVLLVVAVLVLGIWNPFKISTSQEVAKGNACQQLVSMSCSQDASSIAVRGFDANGNGNLNDAGGINDPDNWKKLSNCDSGATSGDNLATLCLCYYNLYSNAECETKLCGCGSGGTGTGGGGSYTKCSTPPKPCYAQGDCTVGTCDIPHTCCLDTN